MTTGHAKVVVIDSKVAYVGSANWNKNGLERNWELTLKTNHSKTIAEASTYVNELWDSGRMTVDFTPHYYERFANGAEFYQLLLEDVRNAKDIKMLMYGMSYNFSDPEAVDSKVLNQLKYAYEQGASLQIVLDDPIYHTMYGGKQFLTQNNIPHKLDDKNIGTLERLHAKIYLIDDEILYIGSQNWHRDSLDASGEASVITRNPDTISDYLAIFDDKWALAIDP
jgi:phosphatidylserine/phosphatidylglycerophosphate/cardiolipin synthase-like enzyme